MRQPAVTPTTTSTTHQLCTFIHLHAHSNTNCTHTHTQPQVHFTPSLPYCVFLSLRATAALTRRSTGIQSWLMACHTHDNTHSKRADAHTRAVSTRMQTQSLYLIEVSGVSDVCLSSWKWSAGVNWCSGCGGGFILQLPTNTLFYTGVLWALHPFNLLCGCRKIKVAVMNCKSRSFSPLVYQVSIYNSGSANYFLPAQNVHTKHICKRFTDSVFDLFADNICSSWQLNHYWL